MRFKPMGIIERLKSSPWGDIRRLIIGECLILYYFKDRDFTVITDQSGEIPTLAEFEEMARTCRRFYEYTTDTEIIEYNMHLREPKERPPAPPKPPRKIRPGFVYVLKADKYYKIGKTNKVSRRISQISPKLPFDPTLQIVIETEDMEKLEASLHQRFEEKHVNGEWFDLSSDDLEYIQGLGTKDA